jgi:hypothetical protein
MGQVELRRAHARERIDHSYSFLQILHHPPLRSLMHQCADDSAAFSNMQSMHGSNQLIGVIAIG